MGIIDTFSDRNEEAAAGVIDQGFKQGERKSRRELRRGFKGLKRDYAAALDKLGKTAGQAGDAITAGRDSALAAYDPYVAATSGAAGLYSDAIGLGGAAGNARAVDAFQAGPGYQFQMDQGMQALQRLNASRGRLDSGNTMIDAMGFAGGLANQEYGNWLNRVGGQQELGANIAGSRAGIYSDAGTNLAGIRERLGTRQAAVKTGLGDVKYGYGEKLGDLAYATRLGRAGAKAGYLMGKDTSGLNVIGALGGVVHGGIGATGAGGGGASTGSQMVSSGRATEGESLGSRLLRT